MDKIHPDNPFSLKIRLRELYSNPLIDQFLSISFNSIGSVWYKLISGKYKTLEKAKTACYNLSDELKTFGPWPRHFASIHNDINKFIKTNKTD